MDIRKGADNFGWLVICSLLAIAIFTVIGFSFRAPPEPIRIGAVQSPGCPVAAGGTDEAETLRALVAATNRQGGLLGRNVELIVANGPSDPTGFAQTVEMLLRDKSVSALFGCWPSSIRKAVKPVVERYGSLLLYSAPYEGLEQSRHIIYAGATPNQQLFPSLTWAKKTFGNKVFLVGSDYLYPRTLNLIARIVAPRIGLEVVGERYLPSGQQDAAGMIEEIMLSGADFVINSISGDSNAVFFHAVDHAYKSDPQKQLPGVISLGLDEYTAITLPTLQGRSYLSSSYFYTPHETILPETPIIEDALSHELADRPKSGAMVATLITYMLWRNTVEHIGSAQPAAVSASIRNRSIRWHSGDLFVGSETGHLFQYHLIAHHQNRVPLEIVWDSGSVIPPEPFPLGLSMTEWEHALLDAKID
ncbi:MAG: transporter substrate-binding protein [Pseudomonadota bacterium]